MKLFLIDASSFVFRAFFALPRLATSYGLPTNAIYGFANMLLSVIEKHKPDYCACVFDSKEKTFRSKIFADYKANREVPPDDLIPQFEQIHRLVDALGIVKLILPGYEADDIIATLVSRFKESETTIVSSDKDLMQLVSERVHLLDTMKNITYGPKEVVEKLGVQPKHVTDYLGLVGDSSDNIPGVAGIGPKTAAELIREFGDLEQILKAAQVFKSSKRRDVLLQSADIARMSKKLATVEHNVEGVQKIKLNDLRLPHEVTAAFREFIAEMEFKSLSKQYPVLQTAVLQTAVLQTAVLQTTVLQTARAGHTPKIVLVKNIDQWKACLNKLSSQPILAFDTETKGNQVTDIEMVGMSLCAGAPPAGEESYYIPVRHSGEDTAHQVPVGLLLEDFQRLIKNKLIIAQNLKYDYRVLLAEGVRLKGRFFDTMLAHYLVEPEEKHGLDFLSLRYLNTKIGDFEEVLGDRSHFGLVPLNDAAQYGAMDAWATVKLYEPLLAALKKLELEKLFYEIEMPVATVLAEMEWNGIRIDPKLLEKLSHEYSKELQELEKEIFECVGYTFNLNSPKQLSEVLFSKLGLPVISKTKTGFSTDQSVLEKLAHLHPVPALIVRYRVLTKLKSTYVDVLPSLIEKDGRVHTNFNQSVTATGRLSSSKPNLQNIPIQTESGKKIREAFIASAGGKLVGADYSQIELRLVAHLSQDPVLLKAFHEKQDVHRATAAEIFNVRPSEVSDQQRRAAKAINFGLIYGKTAFGLSQELGISRHEAQNYIDTYFKRYQGVKEFMQQCIEKARQNKYAVTLFGRRRPIKEIDSKNTAVRNNAERIALNTPLQGTAADLIKLAMINLHHSASTLNAKLVLQVHDELIVDVPAEHAQETSKLLKEKMETAVSLSVPLEVSCGIADHWMDL